MKKEKKQIFTVAAVYIGALIGAGLASGQELMLFFVRYGARGLWGATIAGLAFAFFGAVILLRSKQLQCHSYEQYLQQILGKHISAVFTRVICAFLAVSFCVMLSGSGALFAEQFLLSPVFGVLFTAFICFFAFCADIKGLSAVNLFLVPFMLFGMFAVCFVFLLRQTQEAWLSFSENHLRFSLSVLLYISFNMLSGAAVLVPLGNTLQSKRAACIGGLLGGFALLAVILPACAALFLSEENIFSQQLPLLVLSQGFGKAVSLCYALVLYMAMLTTAAANGFAVLEYCAARGKSKKTSAVFLCFGAIPFSLFPFAKLLETCYRFFGCLGLLLLLAVLLDGIFACKAKRKKSRDSGRKQKK